MGREQVKKEQGPLHVQVTTEPALGSRFASIGIGLKIREFPALLAKIPGPAVLDIDDPTRIETGNILEDIAPWIFIRHAFVPVRPVLPRSTKPAS